MAKVAKETEQLSFMGHDEVGTNPSGVSRSGDQQEHGDKGENVIMGVRGDNKKSSSEGGSKDS